MRAVCLALSFLCACSSYDDLGLLDLEHIEPSEIEAGTTLRLHGGGFALGQAPAVQLSGTVYRPGVPPIPGRVDLIGVVRSASLIEVPITEELIQAIGGRVTFDGELRVSFPSADGHREVFAVEPVRLDFLPETHMQLLSEGLEEESDAAPAAARFGLQLSREELGTAGVRVASVEPGSFAERQGMKAGDVVVALDGVSIYRWRDFEPDPSRTESTVVVARDGLRGTHSLRWPHEVTEHRGTPLVMLLFALLGALIGWTSPAVFALKEQRPAGSAAIWGTKVLVAAVFSALMLFVPSLQWVTLWVLILGTFAALYALATRDRTATSSFAIAVGAALALMLESRSADIVELVAAQTPDVMRWYVFQTPSATLAFGGALVALSLIDRGRLSASLYQAPMAVLVAVLFLGGWPLAEPVVGAAAVFGKAVLLLALAHAITARVSVGVWLSAVAFALGLAGFVVDLDALFPEWSTLAIGFASAFVVRGLFPRLRRSGAPVPA
jgi:hypothetical protein